MLFVFSAVLDRLRLWNKSAWAIARKAFKNALKTANTAQKRTEKPPLFCLFQI